MQEYGRMGAFGGPQFGQEGFYAYISDISQ